MNIEHFGARANDRNDTTPAVRAALEALRDQPGARLVFPAGRYDFFPTAPPRNICGFPTTPKA